MVTCRHRIDCLLELRHHRHIEQNAGLLALEGERSVPNMLSAHPYDIAARLADLQQEFIGQPCACADRMATLRTCRIPPVPKDDAHPT